MSHIPDPTAIEKCAKALSDAFIDDVVTFGQSLRTRKDIVEVVLRCAVEECHYVEPKAFAFANQSYVKLHKEYETLKESSFETIIRLAGTCDMLEGCIERLERELAEMKRERATHGH